ncbi:hypothetical protein BXZ70DRAFT_453327 [Cristinia sonorae]|uniref:NADPH-dependent 1-acyldihydroxyacetone phosphate reductase n=1 Tax=Cristinia sonorae TaxID=1940300 RepID=A0A8K0UIW0_9AGAR|nr:hypothetical protein BXZ70DRAFT_453327 [Cristinia sonorae]
MASKKQTVLITGCSEGGIGEELAKQYHAKGLRVFATARNPAAMASLKASGIETLVLDVTKDESIALVKSQVEELTGGTLNILINNAGVSYPYAASDISMDEVRKLYEVNVFAVMAMTKAFIPLLIASGDGCVINVGSLSGVTPLPFGSVYGSSKAALHSYNDTLRVELAPFGVKVILIVAGNIKSNITKTENKMPENSIYKPIEREFRQNRLQNFHVGAPERSPIVAQIVRESLKRAPTAWLWVALNSWKVWFVSTFLNRTAFDSIVSKRFGLARLAQILKASKRKTA